MKTVQVTQTVEEVAKQYLREENLCAIDWTVMEELSKVYREHGIKVLVFLPDKLTYKLMKEEDWKNTLS